MLVSAGLTRRQLEEIGSPERRTESPAGVSIRPSLEFLIGLSPVARQSLYQALSRYDTNPDHQNPLLIFGELEEWMIGAHLSGAQKKIVGDLIWQRGNVKAFSDISALIKSASSSQEILEARRFMTRRHSYLVQVLAPVAAEREDFMTYWSARGMNPENMSLIRSLTFGDQLKKLDLSILLPALVRQRLYCFPSLKDSVAGRLPDCHWTSLNFFTANPSPYFLDERTSFLQLTQGYVELDAATELGDLLCFTSPNGSILHSCVHLVDDLVLTKNGQNLFSPWLIMRRGEVEEIYRAIGATSLRFFRLMQRGEKL